VYSEYNESDLALVELQEIGFPTPFSPCFTCPATGISCDDHVEEVFAAAGISDPRVGGQNAYGDGFGLCYDLCESNKEGESCSEDWDNGCTVGFMCLQSLLYNQILSNLVS
jgi:hypothetical protein